MKLNLTALRARLERNSVTECSKQLSTVLAEIQYKPCRLWLGATNKAKPNPQGQLSVRVPNGNGAATVKHLYVHRLAYWLSKHPKWTGTCEVPDTLPLVRHTCGNLLCIEPSHMERKS